MTLPRETRTDREGDSPTTVPDGSPPTDDTDGVLSRRAFVLASGACLGTAAIGPASGRGDADPAGDGGLTVTATAPYRPAVASAARAAATADGLPAVRLREPTAPLSEVTAGDVDVHVSGRPVLSPADGTTERSADAVAVAGWGVLAAADEWRECVEQSAVAGDWRPGAPVEAWSETDWQSVEALRGRRERASTAEGGSERRRLPARSDWRPLVRGRRPEQYARGYGGVGYYRVGTDEIATSEPEHRPVRDSGTPLARLGYLYTDGSQESLDALMDASDGGSLRRADGIAHLADPRVGG